MQGVINAYAKLKGRTRKVNIFEKDILVLPVHDEEEQHWYVAIVIRPRLQIASPSVTAGESRRMLLFRSIL